MHAFKRVGAYCSGKEKLMRLWISSQCFNTWVVWEFLWPLSVLIWSLTCRREASFATVQYSAKGRGHYFRKILWIVQLEKLVLVCFCNSLADCFKTWSLGHFTDAFQINSSLYGLCQSLPYFFSWWHLVNQEQSCKFRS